MHSFSALIFSWRMRLTTLKRHKIALSLSVMILIAAAVCGPPIYQESWLDPFSTLDIPNRELRPHAIAMLGILNSDDPFHPYYYTNKGKILELIHNLRRATPLSSSEQDLVSLENQKVQYITLHRTPSTYHTEEDFALQYYTEKGIVRFGQQLFKINEATIYSISQINEGLTTGWWK
ncbi:MAG: hypothetical protein Q8912_03070 [Bacillota bacterium]|nr:hypothetical protein [Bacillota bacterium]MDP4158690.1 hypothetical protein [Bacillota bacterium]